MRVIEHNGMFRILNMPYAYVDAARSIGAGKWVKSEKCWEYPIGSALGILEHFPEITIDDTARESFTREIRRHTVLTNLLTGETEPRDHPFLMEHQKLGRDIAHYKDKYALYYDTGTGKTVMAYAIIEDNPDVKWVVVCPKSIIKAAWMQDHTDFFPHLRILPLSKNIKADDYREIADRWGIEVPGRPGVAAWQEVLMPHAQAVVINPESFKSDKRLKEWGATGLIVDESSIIKDMTAAITKEVIAWSKEVKWAYLLSGKPAPNSELEYFSQMLVVDPAIFGTSYYSFRARYFEPYGYMGYDWRMRGDMRAEFSARLGRGCIFVNKHDCLDLPDELPPVRRLIELPASAQKYYRQMEKEFILELDEKDIAVRTKLASIMKLRQITSGFVLDTAEDGRAEPLHKAKINELQAVIEELGANKAIIWINFKREVAEITALLDAMSKTYVTAYSDTASVDDSIDDFKSDRAQFIIAHPKTLKYGVTFTGPTMRRNCTYAIYYSMSYSFEDFYQSRDRIYRKGQNEGCTYIFLLAENTIDEDIYEVITKKGDTAEIIEKMVRRSQK